MLHCSRVTLSLFSKTKNNTSFLPLLHSLLLILDYHQYCLFIIVIHFMLYYLFYWSFLILRNFDLLDYLTLEERTVFHVIFVLLKNNCDIRSSHSPGFQPCKMEVDFFSCKFFAFAEDKRTLYGMWHLVHQLDVCTTHWWPVCWCNICSCWCFTCSCSVDRNHESLGLQRCDFSDEMPIVVSVFLLTRRINSFLCICCVLTS